MVGFRVGSFGNREDQMRGGRAATHNMFDQATKTAKLDDSAATTAKIATTNVTGDKVGAFYGSAEEIMNQSISAGNAAWSRTSFVFPQGTTYPVSAPINWKTSTTVDGNPWPYFFATQETNSTAVALTKLIITFHQRDSNLYVVVINNDSSAHTVVVSANALTIPVS